jgi:hypothetical protein
MEFLNSHRDILRGQAGCTHVDPDPAVALAIHSDQAGQRLYHDLIPFNQPLVAQVTSHTPGAIATLFDLFAIRVEDPITRIGLWVLARLEQ